jgi:pyridoxine kinase
MPQALILSSFVAASRIGGSAQVLALAGLGVDPVLVPTVLFGASPAKGARGRAVDAQLFADLLAGVESQGVLAGCDLILTGHFSLPDQVVMAAGAIAQARVNGASPLVVVDPVLGDDPRGLYVTPEVAEAVAKLLVPLADWITPNAWELRHLTGDAVIDAPGAVAAARRLGVAALVTSVPAGSGEIALACCEADKASLFTHAQAAQAPNGTGDLVTAVFAAGLLAGLAPAAAAERAALAVAQAVDAAMLAGLTDLPLVALGPQLAHPAAAVRVTILD